MLNGGSDIEGAQTPNSPSGLTPMPTPLAYTDLGDLNIDSDYTFTGGDYLVQNLNVNGTPKIRTQGGRVRIWFKGMNLAGSVGFSGSPDDLWLFSLGNAWQVNINGSCQLTGVVFAPNIPINVSGSNGVFGALVGSTVTLNGGVAMHYDEMLGAACVGGNGGGGGLFASRVGDAPKQMRIASIVGGKQLIIGPNPARSHATAYYRSGQAKRARLTLLTLNGDIVQTLVLQALGDQIGQAELPLDGLANGVYWAVLQTDDGEGWMKKETFKLAVVK